MGYSASVPYRTFGLVGDCECPTCINYRHLQLCIEKYGMSDGDTLFLRELFAAYLYANNKLEETSAAISKSKGKG